MSVEQSILEKLRILPPEKQQEVLDFAEFLTQKIERVPFTQDEIQSSSQDEISKSPLGQRLRAIRAKIVASGESLLTVSDIEQEMAEQRNRLKFVDE
jgi:hypothetical protein